MDVYIYFLFFCVFLYTVYRDDVHRKIKKTQTLFRLINTHHKSMFAIGYAMISIFVKTSYISVCQYFNKTLVQRDKNTHELTYHLGGQLYRIVITSKRGPRKVIQCFDADMTDCTEMISSYLGPSEDFHGQALSPNYFNKDVLTFSMSNGDEKSFNKDDPIVL